MTSRTRGLLLDVHEDQSVAEHPAVTRGVFSRPGWRTTEDPT